MSNAPLMPKATAIWLVENTSLTFDQIAEFCKLHPLEVKGIADGEVGAGIRGHDPITVGQLTREEIEKAEKNGSYQLKLAVSKVRLPEVKRHRGPRYTPLSRRQTGPTPSSGWCATIRSSRTRRSCASPAPPRRPSPQSATAPTGIPPR